MLLCKLYYWSRKIEVPPLVPKMLHFSLWLLQSLYSIYQSAQRVVGVTDAFRLTPLFKLNPPLLILRFLPTLNLDCIRNFSSAANVNFYLLGL